MLEIRHLKTLHALREADSLVEAAERLHLTQSALSHQFKELEERLGLPLFVRKTKPIRFTSAGLRLLQLADATLPLLRGAERDIARLAGGTAGRLTRSVRFELSSSKVKTTYREIGVANTLPIRALDFARSLLETNGGGSGYRPIPV